jgi:exodeoxyribonuclease VII large subunit
MPNARNEAVTVSELTTAISALLTEGIGDVIVEGEISNFKAHSSGHRYFTLKDAGAQIACVMWRTRSLDFVPQDGMHVILGGRLTVYPPQGKYQIDVVWMRPAGVGALQRLLKSANVCSLPAAGLTGNGNDRCRYCLQPLAW